MPYDQCVFLEEIQGISEKIAKTSLNHWIHMSVDLKPVKTAGIIYLVIFKRLINKDKFSEDVSTRVVYAIKGKDWKKCKLGKPCAQKSGKDPSLRLIRTLCWHSIVQETITNLIFMMYLNSGQQFAVVAKIVSRSVAIFDAWPEFY